MTAAGQADAGPPLVLRAATLADGRRVDIAVRDGVIRAIGRAGELGSGAAGSLDLSGLLLLPAPVEAHAHLDKAYSADRAVNQTGDLAGAVTAWLRHRPAMTEDDIADRAAAAVRDYLGNGATAIRTHVDVGADIGLRAVAALARVRAAVAADCVVQLVAFASAPLTGAAGATHRALLRAALAGGADAVGACPACDPDPAACIEVCLQTAADLAVPIDLHIDEGTDVEPCTLAMLADAVTAIGFHHGVVASHCVSLGMMAPDRARKIADRVAAARIAVICLPQTNLYLQGRGYPVATPRGLTALRTLRAAGVSVVAGGDNLQDPFNCLGRADPLETAALLVLAGHEPPELAYASVSTAARRVLGLPGGEVAVGVPAELLAIRAGSIRQAVATAHPDRIVVHAGRIVAQTSTTRRFSPPPPSGSLAGTRPDGPYPSAAEDLDQPMTARRIV